MESSSSMRRRMPVTTGERSDWVAGGLSADDAASATVVGLGRRLARASRIDLERGVEEDMFLEPNLDKEFMGGLSWVEGMEVVREVEFRPLPILSAGGWPPGMIWTNFYLNILSFYIIYTIVCVGTHSSIYVNKSAQKILTSLLMALICAQRILTRSLATF